MSPILCTTVIGRRGEFTRLVEVLDPPGGTVFLHGEAGIGKSRLVRELTDEARRRSVPVWSGRAVPASPPTPYRPSSCSRSPGA